MVLCRNSDIYANGEEVLSLLEMEGEEISACEGLLVNLIMKIFTCEVCEKAYKTAQSLRCHRLIHDDVKPYV
jgi:hypothetical protein